MADYIKEMVYSVKRIEPERIAEGDYKGFHYYVINQGTHPCAYVDVRETKLCGKDYCLIDIPCHCGLTYSRNYLATVDEKGWFIGWDYAHYCDFAGYELAMPESIRTNGKRWTTEEIVSECEEVINEIIKLLKEGAIMAEKEYIEREALKSLLHQDDFDTPDERWRPESEFAAMIDAIPAADVVEVKHGEWVNAGVGITERVVCSNCKSDKGSFMKPPLCNQCGAKIAGKGE